MKWVNVRDKLPSQSCKVLCFGSRGVGTAIFSHGNRDGVYSFRCSETGDDEGFCGWDDNEFIVTHWMPLPEPPKQ